MFSFDLRAILRTEQGKAEGGLLGALGAWTSFWSPLSGDVDFYFTFTSIVSLFNVFKFPPFFSRHSLSPLDEYFLENPEEQTEAAGCFSCTFPGKLAQRMRVRTFCFSASSALLCQRLDDFPAQGSVAQCLSGYCLSRHCLYGAHCTIKVVREGARCSLRYKSF